MVILFIIPIFVITLIGTGEFSLMSSTSNIYIIDYDNSEKSQEFICTFKENATIEATVMVKEDFNMSAAEFEAYAKEKLPTVDIVAYIILVENFSENIRINGSTELPIYIDYIDFFAAYTAQASILDATVRYQLINQEYESDLFYFPVMKPQESINVLQIAAPFLSAVLIFACMNLITTQCIVGDKPLKRMLTTPTFRFEVIIAKIGAYTILATFQIVLILLILEFGFGLQFRCLFIELFLMLLILALNSVVIGVFFSSISSNRLQSSQLFLFFFIIMLLITQIVRIPIIVNILPLEQATAAFTDLAYRGKSLFDVWPNLLNLSIVSLFFFTINIIYFQYIKKEFV
jgi:ABC-type multidrug transport system permease subunit